jgi:hypothetical protein
MLTTSLHDPSDWSCCVCAAGITNPAGAAGDAVQGDKCPLFTVAALIIELLGFVFSVGKRPEHH